MFEYVIVLVFEYLSVLRLAEEDMGPFPREVHFKMGWSMVVF